MTYVIGSPCIDVTDRSCMEECPVDCIYEGDRKLYINPAECIDCGACLTVCPVEAVAPERKLTEDEVVHRADNEQFFTLVLPGRTEPLGAPGGSAKIGRLGVDTPLVASASPS